MDFPVWQKQRIHKYLPISCHCGIITASSYDTYDIIREKDSLDFSNGHMGECYETDSIYRRNGRRNRISDAGAETARTGHTGVLEMYARNIR